MVMPSLLLYQWYVTYMYVHRKNWFHTNGILWDFVNSHLRKIPSLGYSVFPQSNINSTLDTNNNINGKYHSSCSHYGYLYNTLMETMFTYIPILGAHDNINGKYCLFPLWVSLQYINGNSLQLHSHIGCSWH